MPMSDFRGVPPITADELERERGRLSRVRTREGYDVAEVDDLLDRLVRELRSSQPAMTAEDIDDARLTPVRIFKPGYDLGEVDDLLDRAARALRDKGAVRPVAEAGPAEPAAISWVAYVAPASLVAAAIAVLVLLR